ncbi:MAG: DUF177 domain-containing protein [Peptococcia bacterium]
MKLGIADLLKTPGAKKSFAFELKDFPEVSSFTFTQSVKIQGEVVNTGVGLTLTGHGETTIKGTCDCCLDDVSIPLVFDFTEDYLPESEAEEFREELESDLVLHYNDEWLDLGEIFSENLLLNLPMRTVCRPDCPGICPICGKNLNEGNCQCDQKEIDPRLAILAKLKVDH